MTEKPDKAVLPDTIAVPRKPPFIQLGSAAELPYNVGLFNQVSYSSPREYGATFKFNF